MSKKALVILAEGFEEIEAIVPIDILRRATVKVTVASLNRELSVTGRSNITVNAEISLEKATEEAYDAILLPGGAGAQLLKKDPTVLQLLKEYHKEKKWIGAICAAPLVLKEAGILQDKKYTAHFSVEKELPDIQRLPVAVDDNIITSQGAGTAIPFTLALVSVLESHEVANSIQKSICL